MRRQPDLDGLLRKTIRIMTAEAQAKLEIGEILLGVAKH
jgi:hypothetical protein